MIFCYIAIIPHPMFNLEDNDLKRYLKYNEHEKKKG